MELSIVMPAGSGTLGVIILSSDNTDLKLPGTGMLLLASPTPVP